jgi:hypothetical protein
MPRKLRTPKTRVSALPSPAWTYALLAGDDPQCRLRGWPLLYQEFVGEPAADEVWARHQTALLEEAAAHDFTPAWISKQPPRGDGFQRWRAAFVAAHRY